MVPKSSSRVLIECTSYPHPILWITGHAARIVWYTLYAGCIHTRTPPLPSDSHNIGLASKAMQQSMHAFPLVISLVNWILTLSFVDTNELEGADLSFIQIHAHSTLSMEYIEIQGAQNIQVR